MFFENAFLSANVSLFACFDFRLSYRSRPLLKSSPAKVIDFCIYSCFHLARQANRLWIDQSAPRAASTEETAAVDHETERSKERLARLPTTILPHGVAQFQQESLANWSCDSRVMSCELGGSTTLQRPMFGYEKRRISERMVCLYLFTWPSLKGEPVGGRCQQISMQVTDRTSHPMVYGLADEWYPGKSKPLLVCHVCQWLC